MISFNESKPDLNKVHIFVLKRKLERKSKNRYSLMVVSFRFEGTFQSPFSNTAGFPIRSTPPGTISSCFTFLIQSTKVLPSPTFTTTPEDGARAIDVSASDLEADLQSGPARLEDSRSPGVVSIWKKTVNTISCKNLNSVGVSSSLRRNPKPKISHQDSSRQGRSKSIKNDDATLKPISPVFPHVPSQDNLKVKGSSSIPQSWSMLLKGKLKKYKNFLRLLSRSFKEDVHPGYLNSLVEADPKPGWRLFFDWLKYIPVLYKSHTIPSYPNLNWKEVGTPRAACENLLSELDDGQYPLTFFQNLRYEKLLQDHGRQYGFAEMLKNYICDHENDFEQRKSIKMTITYSPD
ncbi:hypothetical protein O181_095106 [Austropuccinia psidii MF-1]|uniref:Uncharacterized protein n=1 Tax=Austropuccinia psidii MF-1 TaxID=1389203 RepID=A0A9Q3J4S6_9BASI|nr:hypothetical protein [Austropuccinia psidii MF-1]